MIYAEVSRVIAYGIPGSLKQIGGLQTVFRKVCNFPAFGRVEHIKEFGIGFCKSKEMPMDRRCAAAETKNVNYTLYAWDGRRGEKTIGC